MKTLTLDDVKAAVRGGSILAAGGGGWISHGLLLGELAVKLGSPQLADLDDLDDDDLVITVSFVGAPAAPDAFVAPLHYIRAVELFQQRTGLKVAGLVSSENGSSSTVNGWLQSAILGIPVVDAPCNGRAHPTGRMGSLGLPPDFETVQVAVGGDPRAGNHIETVVAGTMARVPPVIRAAAAAAGGGVAVARNPVPIRLLRDRAAVGGIDYALRLGHRAIESLEAHGPGPTIQAVADHLTGLIQIEGEVESVSRTTAGGFDKGVVVVRSQDGRLAKIHTYNEYLVLEIDGTREATFPDLIAVFDTDTSEAMAFGDIESGAHVTVVTASRHDLPLGAGVWEPSNYLEIEDALDVDLRSHVFGQQDNDVERAEQR